MNLNELKNTVDTGKHTAPLPVVFIGHGSPMNAVETNVFTESWKALADTLPRPQAILSVSAHWLTPGHVKVLAEPHPRTIYDFGGFPEVLYRQHYTAPGSPEYAKATADMLKASHAQLDHEWGFDHGTWSILKQMYPEATIPVYQLSLDYSKPPRWHYELAQQLKKLRTMGVLIVGSGNIVHNLHAINPSGNTYDWALEFDNLVAGHLTNGNDQGIVDFLELGQLAKVAHPTHDHYLPLLYTIGAKNDSESVKTVTDGFDLGSISMRSFVAG